MLKIFFFFFYFSLTAQEIPVSIGSVYKNKNDVLDSDVEKIFLLSKKLILCTIEKNKKCFLESISKQKGVYVDLKAIWTYKEVESEITKQDSYFDIFFFDSEKLKSYTKNENSKTVKEILESADEIFLDIYFDSIQNAEINIRFKNGNKLEKDLNNPYFIKEKNKWFLFRFF